MLGIYPCRGAACLRQGSRQTQPLAQTSSASTEEYAQFWRRKDRNHVLSKRTMQVVLSNW